MEQRTSTNSYIPHATSQPSLWHMLSLTAKKKKHPISMTHHDNAGTANPAQEYDPWKSEQWVNTTFTMHHQPKPAFMQASMAG